MRLLMVNSLIMFDIVFVFFLFLIAVTCIVYYSGGGRRRAATSEEVDSDVIPPPPLFDDRDDELCVADTRSTYIVIPSPANLRNKTCGPVNLV